MSLELYSWDTPNGQKVHIMLEECGLACRIYGVDIGAGAQFDPAFLAISPNNKIPALIDTDGPDGGPLHLFESGAILIYLAGKTGRFLPESDHGRFGTLQWLMFQMGSVGPMLGQAHHFRFYAPQRIEYAVERYTREAQRLYRVMEGHLQQNPWFSGGDYGIADMAIFPWLRYHERQGVDLADFPAVRAWYERIHERPAVQRALKILADERPAQFDEKARENLFGATQSRQGR
jgi:GST-like protein